MRFGKIEYLNLLPFDTFIKAYPLSASSKKFITLKKSYPSRLNHDFLFRRIDAGFISSIAGMYADSRHKALPCGIISKGAVWSVLAKSGSGLDYQSATSNALLRVLELKGEVLIGDRALKFKADGGKALDLGELWWHKHKLPFVFGRLCYNKYGKYLEQITKAFTKHHRYKIPHYILHRAARDTQIQSNYIREYLKRIFYSMGTKEHIALHRFYRELRLRRIKPPQRFEALRGCKGGI
ncbi:MqnA/MqnD/SBP family protein [Helicobacter sp. 10-6591]|uniref:MqnA/MqnD/SBP family protein n=1 Tax=Helicobacter sp. 10-6591 TaxID=2004998 RepID=UPI000DCBC6B8|nr:MqnA/MqnD/SBP family protein [Helicobacter sp. 10-6591]MCI7484727.1 menaquinone biosynthesis protein [Helicobacter sp.]RAX56286.1 menaquinone biosynthesis protein [Helicobacter sp. 10-6591]